MTAWAALVRLAVRELLASRPLVALAGVIVIVVAALNALLLNHFAITPVAEAGSAEEVATTIGIAAYVAAVVTPGIVFSTLLPTPLARAQATGRLRGLLATTLTPHRVWTAYAVALWMVATAAAWVVTGAVVAALHRSAPVRDAVGGGGGAGWALDGGLLVTAVVMVPLVFLGLALAVTGLAMTVSVGAGNVLGVLAYAGLASTVPRVAAQLSATELGLIHVALALALLLAAWVVGRRVDAPRLAVVGS